MTVRVDPAAARAVAAAYAGADTRRDPVTRAAYARLAAECDRLLRRITSPLRPGAVRVRYTTCADPYADAGELIASVTGDRLLEVVTVAADRHRRHPLLDSTRGGAYDRFRAVHDVVGHGRLPRVNERAGRLSRVRARTSGAGFPISVVRSDACCPSNALVQLQGNI